MSVEPIDIEGDSSPAAANDHEGSNGILYVDDEGEEPTQFPIPQ